MSAGPRPAREPTGLIGGYQGIVERLFFRGRRSPVSEAVSFISANLFLVVVVFYLLLNTVVYDWTGSLYAHGFHLATALDSAIPFVPEWAIFYLYLFYPVSALTMAWFSLVEYRRGYPLAVSLVVINLVADAVYLVFPVTTDLWRAQILSHPMTGNVFARAMYDTFASDPSFNCFPSLHAAVATICFYAWYRWARQRPLPVIRGISVGMLAVGVGVVLSTLFVKQHYIADEIAGILLALGVGRIVFDRREPAPAR
ncbi:MAG TPA: phosphatase PAP2 family protein [Spirochaetia bacterium]|nr:phosphatase PAP2 family protein [Spirochaetia bacterium]